MPANNGDLFDVGMCVAVVDSSAICELPTIVSAVQKVLVLLLDVNALLI